MRSSRRCGSWPVSAAAAARSLGLRVTEPEGWWPLRSSGTEPKLTIRCEAGDESGLRRLREALAEHLRACGIELQAGRAAGDLGARRPRVSSARAR